MVMVRGWEAVEGGGGSSYMSLLPWQLAMRSCRRSPHVRATALLRKANSFRMLSLSKHVGSSSAVRAAFLTLEPTRRCNGPFERKITHLGSFSFQNNNIWLISKHWKEVLRTCCFYFNSTRRVLDARAHTQVQWHLWTKNESFRVFS